MAAVLDSNKSLSVDQSFTINVGVIRASSDRGGGKTTTTHTQHSRAIPIINTDNTRNDCSIKKKKSMVLIPEISGEFICAARAIVVCMESLNGRSSLKYRHICRSKKSLQKNEALKLLRAVGLSAQKPVNVPDLIRFERYLKTQIVVISGDMGCEVIYKGQQNVYEKKIFLYLKDQHFHCIIDIKGFYTRNRKLCVNCLEIYPKTPFAKHFCSMTCTTCQRDTCITDNTSITCSACNTFCRNRGCYESHRTPGVYKAGPNRGTPKLSLCQNFFKCPDCFKIIDTKKSQIKDHICGEYFCKTCQKKVKESDDEQHLCYYRCRKPRTTSGRFLIYDFETNQSDYPITCPQGYSPQPKMNCDQCFDDYRCSKCRKCTNCKRGYCGLQRHVPNYVVCHSVCDSCKNDPFTSDSRCDNCGDRCSLCSARGPTCFDNPPCANCGKRETVFKGYDTVNTFCQWLISPIHTGYIVMAHNSKNFDSHFILNHCTEAGVFPEIVYQGTKIVTMCIKEIKLRFIDSINFLPFSLKKVATSFNLQYTKGYFPHMVNTIDMIGYVGKMPEPSSYGIDTMSESARKEFMEWYDQNSMKTFNFDEELDYYAKQDVHILREATMRFRDMIRDITTIEGSKVPGIDVYCFNTIAGATMHIIRLLTMYEHHSIELHDGSVVNGIYKRGEFFVDNIAIHPSQIKTTEFIKSPIPMIPARGYTRQYADSEIAIVWLEWKSREIGKPIRHSRNSGEVRIEGTRYLVDGYYEEEGPDGQIIKVCLEFLGCFHHSHPQCQPDRNNIRNSRTGLTMAGQYKRTMKRLESIRQLGYKVEVMWECHFKEMMESSEELRLFAAECDVPKPIVLRDAFQGGRCEAMKLHDIIQEDEKIRYLDVISLYPSSVLDPMPICHPRIISNEADFDYSLKTYNLAIIKLRILPPRKLYVPVLGFKSRNKLKFALCYRCAENELVTPCKCTDQQRSFIGTWTNLEINEATKMGYSILKIFQIYSYEETSRERGSHLSVFPEYISMFIKVKTEASGWASWVRTDEDKDRYIDNFYRQQGIKLEKHKIISNPPLRLIAKLFLNSCWGKFVERLDLPRTVYVKTRDQLALLLNDVTKRILNFNLISEEFIVIEYKAQDQFLEDPAFQNVVFGIFTTSIARITLLKLLQKTDTRTIYTDTDSVIYKEKDGENILQIGDQLGDLSDELPDGQHICEILCSGPKSYSYRVSDNSFITKVKGFTLSHKTAQHINFDSIKSIVFGENDSIRPPPFNQISRVKHHGIVYNKPCSKIFKKVFNKRVVQSEMHDSQSEMHDSQSEKYDSLPYGF